MGKKGINELHSDVLSDLLRLMVIKNHVDDNLKQQARTFYGRIDFMLGPSLGVQHLIFLKLSTPRNLTFQFGLRKSQVFKLLF